MFSKWHNYVSAERELAGNGVTISTCQAEQTNKRYPPFVIYRLPIHLVNEFKKSGGIRGRKTEEVEKEEIPGKRVSSELLWCTKPDSRYCAKENSRLKEKPPSRPHLPPEKLTAIAECRWKENREDALRVLDAYYW